MTWAYALITLVFTVTTVAMRDDFGLMPHVYFDWTEGSPLVHFLRFILWGSG